MSGGDPKYGGRLFTERDLIAVCNQIEKHRREGTLDNKLIIDVADEIGPTFPADEPLFVLRAQDTHAMVTIGSYFGHLDSDSPDEHLTAVAKALRTFAEWQVANPDRVKVPD